MKEKIEKLNEVKKIFLLGGPFKKQPFLKALKECGIKMVDCVFSEMIKQEILVKQKKLLLLF